MRTGSVGREQAPRGFSLASRDVPEPMQALLRRAGKQGQNVPAAASAAGPWVAGTGKVGGGPGRRPGAVLRARRLSQLEPRRRLPIHAPIKAAPASPSAQSRAAACRGRSCSRCPRAPSSSLPAPPRLPGSQHGRLGGGAPGSGSAARQARLLKTAAQVPGTWPTVASEAPRQPGASKTPARADGPAPASAVARSPQVALPSPPRLRPAAEASRRAWWRVGPGPGRLPGEAGWRRPAGDRALPRPAPGRGLEPGPLLARGARGRPLALALAAPGRDGHRGATVTRGLALTLPAPAIASGVSRVQAPGLPGTRCAGSRCSAIVRIPEPGTLPVSGFPGRRAAHKGRCFVAAGPGARGELCVHRAFGRPGPTDSGLGRASLGSCMVRREVLAEGVYGLGLRGVFGFIRGAPTPTPMPSLFAPGFAPFAPPPPVLDLESPPVPVPESRSWSVGWEENGTSWGLRSFFCS